MNKIVIKTLTFTILIGIVALAFNTILGSNTIPFLEKQLIYYGTDNHFFIWKINIWSYLKNIELSVSDVSILQLELPSREWQAINSISDFGNNLALMLDYVITIINIILYPLKVGAYLLRNIIAILGINTQTTDPNNGLAWVTIFINEILGRIVIPYI